MGWVPTKPIVEKRTYASAMSYVGSTRRALAWCRSHTGAGFTAKNVALWILASVWIVSMWVVVTCWYAITFILFGIFMIPWRLIRRSQRKNEHLQQQQLATMQAMMLQQQQR
jgi:Flp pilus assembly protein TadB